MWAILPSFLPIFSPPSPGRGDPPACTPNPLLSGFALILGHLLTLCVMVRGSASDSLLDKRSVGTPSQQLVQRAYEALRK